MQKTSDASSFILQPSALASIAKPGIDAVRRMWVPFVLIQLCALAVVIAYFRSDGFYAFCQKLAAIKASGGMLFSILAMGFAAGVLPEVFKLLTRADDKTFRQRGRDAVFNTLLFGVAGIYVDTFYTWVGRVFPTATPAAVLAKVLLDQLGYTLLVGLPWMALMYTWREHRYRVVPTARSLGVAWYVGRVAPLLLPCWAYWVPMTGLMYVLPPTLTFIFGLAANTASAVILITVAARKTDRQNVEPSREHQTLQALQTVDV